MAQALHHPGSTVVADARDAAAAAARAAGCTVRTLVTLPELEQGIGIFRSVWGRDGASDIIPIETLRALSHAGNHAAGAFVDDELAGAIVGFLGMDEGVVTLHSHVMGLLEGRRSRGMGFALKQHQRAWALDRGIDRITWTFDPLVRQNAYFNLHKLGAEATGYHADFYGVMHDGINGGEPSDRLLVTWDLRSDRAVAASRRELLEGPNGSAPPAILDADRDGRPVVQPAAGDRFRVVIPADIVEVRRRDAALAREWRLAVRDTLGAAIQDGLRATVGGRDGCYLIAP